MKSRDTLIRLKKFQVDEKRRRVRQIELMTSEFTRMIGDLDREIATRKSAPASPMFIISPIDLRPRAASAVTI